jgi:hypothetical protein
MNQNPSNATTTTAAEMRAVRLVQLTVRTCSAAGVAAAAGVAVEGEVDEFVDERRV